MPKRCPICLENLSNVNIIILNCGHRYHIDCYTSFIIHEVKKSVEDETDIDIKCAMCRSNDGNMFIPIFTEFKNVIENEFIYKDFVEDIHLKLFRQFFPHINTILKTSYKFNKENLAEILENIIKNNKRSIRKMIRDLKKDLQI